MVRRKLLILISLAVALHLGMDTEAATLEWSTFLGGSGTDFGVAIAVDTSGCAYVGGHTTSVDFPTTAGAFDVGFNGGGEDGFITKFIPDGSALAYSTFLGGAGADHVEGMLVEGSGAAIVSGWTQSADFPVTANAFDTSLGGSRDVFVARLSADGSAVTCSTFVGGSGYDSGGAQADLDSAGNVYTTGSTQSEDFPVTDGALDSTYNGSGDGFILKFDPVCSTAVYGTFFGGSGPDSVNCTGSA